MSNLDDKKASADRDLAAGRTIDGADALRGEYAIKMPGDRGVVTLPGADPGYEYPSGSLAIAAAIIGGMRHGDHFELARDGECLRTNKVVPPGEYELVAIGRLP